MMQEDYAQLRGEQDYMQTASQTPFAELSAAVSEVENARSAILAMVDKLVGEAPQTITNIAKGQMANAAVDRGLLGQVSTAAHRLNCATVEIQSALKRLHSSI